MYLLYGTAVRDEVHRLLSFPRKTFIMTRGLAPGALDWVHGSSVQLLVDVYAPLTDRTELVRALSTSYISVRHLPGIAFDYFSHPNRSCYSVVGSFSLADVPGTDVDDLDFGVNYSDLGDVSRHRQLCDKFSRLWSRAIYVNENVLNSVPGRV